MLPAVFLLVAIIVLRLAPWLGGKEAVDAFSGFTPLVAYALCGGVFLNRKQAAWFPVLAIIVTHGIINVLCANEKFVRVDSIESFVAFIIIVAAVVVVSAVGVSVKKKASFGVLLGTVTVSTVLFFLVSNTVSFFMDQRYEFSFLGWVRALTLGLPGWPPTWEFLLRSLAGNIVFTVLFYALCRNTTHRHGTVPAADDADRAESAVAA